MPLHSVDTSKWFSRGDLCARHEWLLFLIQEKMHWCTRWIKFIFLKLPKIILPYHSGISNNHFSYFASPTVTVMRKNVHFFHTLHHLNQALSYPFLLFFLNLKQIRVDFPQRWDHFILWLFSMCLSCNADRKGSAPSIILYKVIMLLTALYF